MTQSSPKEIIVEARGLARSFPAGSADVLAVKDVNLEVFRGELLVILGRSGSGKTTLLNLLGGLDRPTHGQVLFEGQDLSTMSEKELTAFRRHKVGFIFQSYGLLPLLSAYENVELPLRINGVPGSERRRLAEKALDRVGLSARARHRPYELSGGEQQRVAIARALVGNPLLLLADEPTGDLDTTTGLNIATLLKSVALEQGATVVVATHDITLADMASRTTELVDGSFTS
ncbi:MAG: ABC transporter ATP-binding protein [Chloroflexi bacterium]|nr:ABC transporter ATP-binding protein [Chloroflexota bacterium]